MSNHAHVFSSSAQTGDVVQCFVYASVRKPETYLWLNRRDDFGCLPEPLALLLGDLRFVLEVDLSERRRLPHEDARQIMTHLREQGWHLQLPPTHQLAAADPSAGPTFDH